MTMRSDDFQSLYRRYAYSLYREVFEELNDVEATREILYRIFSRVREEGMDDSFDLETRIYQYKLEYVKERKKAQLDLGRVWYRMQNDEILGREPQMIQPQTSEVVMPVEETTHVEETASADEAIPVEETTLVEETTPEVTVSTQSIDELLADMERKRKRPRRIREVFPDEEEASASSTEENSPEELPEETTPKRKKSVAVCILWVLLTVAIALFLWILANLLMAQGIIPFFDLGYAWFNENIAVLFPIIAEITG